LLNDGYNVIPVLDHLDEFDFYKKNVKAAKCKLGIRISTEEEPSFAFYSSRLGVRYTDIISLYQDTPFLH
jgi:arginine decarboxylase